MSALTTLTRMWLCRSLRPFTFQKEYDQTLPYEDCRNLGLYVHIPFCRQICSFCPYCKEVYRTEACDRYIDSLLTEIHLVGRQQEGKKQVTSLYFGGGTPALAADRLGEIIAALQEHFEITEGIGVELIKLNTLAPLIAEPVYHSVAKTGRLVVVEECFTAGSIGQQMLAALEQRGGLSAAVRLLNLGDQFIAQGSVAQLRRSVGIDAGGIAKTIREVCHGKG